MHPDVTPLDGRQQAAAMLTPRLSELAGVHPVFLAVSDSAVPLARALGLSFGALRVYRTGLESQPSSVRGALGRFRGRANDQLLGFGTGSPNAAQGLQQHNDEVGHAAHMSAPRLKDRVVVLVDDGTTGDQVLRANVEDLRNQAPARLLLVAPVLPKATADWLDSEVDRLVALHLPEEFGTPADWYAEDRKATEVPVHGPFLNVWDGATQLLPLLEPWRSLHPLVVALGDHAAPVAQIVATGLATEAFVHHHAESRPVRTRDALGGLRRRSTHSMLEWQDSRLQALSEHLSETVRSMADTLPANMPSVAGRVVLLVDDGLTSDTVLQTTVAELKDREAISVLLAAPVLPQDTAERLGSEVDAVIALFLPRDFGRPEDWYVHL